MWIFLGVITKLDYTMHFWVFSEGQGTKSAVEDTFWVAKISNIYLGFLKFLIFFWGER